MNNLNSGNDLLPEFFVFAADALISSIWTVIE